MHRTRFVAPALLLLSSACAAPGPELDRQAGPLTLVECRELLTSLDDSLRAQGVMDVEDARVEGFPYLRVNRYLAAEPRPSPGTPAFVAWVRALRSLDEAGRTVELANSAPVDVLELAADRTGRGIEWTVTDCGDRLAADLVRRPDEGAALMAAAWVPSDYNLGLRIAGLYPFTGILFNAGVGRLHRELRADFEAPLSSLPVTGRLTEFAPPADATDLLDAREVAEMLARSSRNPLGMPLPDEADLDRLFAAFAPVWQVDVATDDDRIGTPTWGTPTWGTPTWGTPTWNGDLLPAVDITRPVVYRRVSHARFGGATLLQLNYVVWFPARPPLGRTDLLAGRLDGLTFRITLGADGRALLYDSMHNCGCYHLFLPTSRLTPKPPPTGFEEAPFIAQVVPEGTGRLIVRLASRTHYVQRVYWSTRPTDATELARADYRALRTLPLPNGGTASLFGPDGLVRGTERGERWLFWPMGVEEPGAMRQWGHHAIAFVGQRHFDDPDLIERYFQ